MFYLYTGYGYCWYELDDDYYDDEYSLGYLEDKEQFVKSWILELPDDAQKEIELSGKTTVNYLLVTDDPDITWIAWSGAKTEKIRFYFCEDEPQWSHGNGGYQLPRKKKTITITSDEIISSEKWEAYLKSKNVINSNLASERVLTPSNKYEARNIDFQAWIDETKPDLNSMTKNDIHKILIARNSSLWTSGFIDWWKQQTIYKGIAGRKRK